MKRAVGRGVGLTVGWKKNPPAFNGRTAGPPPRRVPARHIGDHLLHRRNPTVVGERAHVDRIWFRAPDSPTFSLARPFRRIRPTKPVRRDAPGQIRKLVGGKTRPVLALRELLVVVTCARSPPASSRSAWRLTITGACPPSSGVETFSCGSPPAPPDACLTAVDPVKLTLRVHGARRSGCFRHRARIPKRAIDRG